MEWRKDPMKKEDKKKLKQLKNKLILLEGEFQTLKGLLDRIEWVMRDYSTIKWNKHINKKPLIKDKERNKKDD